MFGPTGHSQQKSKSKEEKMDILSFIILPITLFPFLFLVRPSSFSLPMRVIYFEFISIAK